MQATVGQAVLGKEDLLAAAGVFVEFDRAAGDHLYMHDDEGREQPVLDLVGGFGASLLGHYHPDVTQVLQSCIEQQRPFHAQGSRRQRALELKESLADYLLRHTGGTYRICLLNTGTEAVEAALKHARLAFAKRVERCADAGGANVRELQTRLERGEFRIGDALLQQGERLLGQEGLGSLDDLLAAMASFNCRAFGQEPLIAAFPLAFHGKTMGSLAHTWNRDARLPFIRNHRGALFIHDAASFLAEVGQRTLAWAEFEFNPLRLVLRTMPLVAAVIYEPIRGEGGVLELGEAEKALLRELRARHPEVALIADEIQCGLGRTGRAVESHAAGLPADYLTFAKSLGGGLVKVSALAVRSELYIPEFGTLHSSTFAEDDLSSAVARRALEVIERDDVAGRSAAIGRAFLEQLHGLQQRWPAVIREVRGRGCMLGLELQDFAEHPSAVLSSLSRERLLGMLAAGYLLHRHHVRVLPSLGRRGVLRLQPSAYLEPAAMQQATAALDALCALLDGGEVAPLLEHLAGPAPAQAAPRVAVEPGPRRLPRELPGASSGGGHCDRVGFIAHLIDPDSVREWEPAIAGYSDEQLSELRSRMQHALEPQVIARRRVRSAVGREVELVLFGILMDAETIEADMRHNKAELIRRQVREAYRKAREEGCRLVGFGGYTSIVTSNCSDFEHEHPAVTTGNSLTVATSIASLRQAAHRHGITMAGAQVAIVGAAGNIGQVHAALLAHECGSLVLLGRAGSTARLHAVVGELAAELLATLRREADAADPAPGRLMQQVREAFAPRLDAERDDRALADELGGALLADGWVRIADSPLACRSADIVVCASNSARPLLDGDCFAADRPVLICDVAVPGDVDRASLDGRGNLKLIRGGVVHLPTAPDFDLPGMLLDPGQVYACAGETLLLGLAGVRCDFSKGAIRASQVREIAALAKLHGFEIDRERRVGGF